MTDVPYAMACPSEVAVPLPSSSKATKEFLVAERCEVYNHMKVNTIRQVLGLWMNKAYIPSQQVYNSPA
jgi:hypothetical protein